MGLAIFWIVFLIFAFLLFSWINRRTIKKNLVHRDKACVINGTFYLEEMNAMSTGEITFHPEKFITIKFEDGTDFKINGNEIRRLRFPLTGSLATSYLLIKLKNKKSILFFNGVNIEQLKSKVTAVLVDSAIASSAVSGAAMVANRGNKNPYWTSDEHTGIHAWLTKNSFPGYKSTLVTSDWVGFILLLLLPAMILIGTTIETLTKALFNSQETGSAIMGWLVIIAIVTAGAYRVLSTLRLRRILNQAKTHLKNQSDVI